MSSCSTAFSLPHTSYVQTEDPTPELEPSQELAAVVTDAPAASPADPRHVFIEQVSPAVPSLVTFHVPARPRPRPPSPDAVLAA